MVKTYNSIIKEKKLTEISYQKDFLTNGKFLNSKKPFVLAMGTSAGKTLTTIMMLEMFYRIKGNSKKKTLIIPSSTIILRENFENSLDDYKPTFSYSVIKNKIDLINAKNDENCNVIVSLPQTLNRNIKLLNKVDIFILDEAHQWYFKKTIANLIDTIKPKLQLLLCGSPSKFNAKSNQFQFHYVPIEDLLSEKQITNAYVKIISSPYKVFESDFENKWGDLKSNKLKNDNENKKALKIALDKILELTIKDEKLNESNIGAIFLKTIIFCHSIHQSNTFIKILNSHKLLKNRILISHQKSDKSSVMFDEFRKNKKMKILICVNRGRLGFSMNHLFNVIDFTLTKNIDTMLQIYGRLLRKSEHKKPKIYFKVAPKGLEIFYTNIMTAMLSLIKRENYEKYNGKNLSGLKIPKIISNTNSVSTNSNSTLKNKLNQFDLESFGLDLDLNLFKCIDDVNNKSDVKVFSYTSLEEVNEIFYPSKTIKWDEESILNELKRNNNDITKLRKKEPYAYRKGVEMGIIKPFKEQLPNISNDELIKLYKPLTKGLKNRTEFRSKYRKEYGICYRKGLLDEICNKFPKSVEKSNFTFNEVKLIAKKYKRRIDFSKGDTKAYYYSRRRGWLDKICGHMKVKKLLTINHIIEECLNYDSLKDLKINNPNYYKYASSNGLIEKLRGMYDKK